MVKQTRWINTQKTLNILGMFGCTVHQDISQQQHRNLGILNTINYVMVIKAITNYIGSKCETSIDHIHIMLLWDLYISADIFRVGCILLSLDELGL